MRPQIKRTLAIGVAVLSVGLFGVAAYAMHNSQPNLGAAMPAATPDPALAMPSPSPVPAQGKDSALKKIVGELSASAASYLGITSDQLKTDVKSGQSLADIAAATPGKSRDGLIAALTTSADQQIDAAVTAGTLTAQQASLAKTKMSTQIAAIVDRKGTTHG